MTGKPGRSWVRAWVVHVDGGGDVLIMCGGGGEK